MHGPLDLTWAKKEQAATAVVTAAYVDVVGVRGLPVKVANETRMRMKVVRAKAVRGKG
jgi:hypothetical protein